MTRANILKTYKLYIGGKFPRTESGRYFQIIHPKSKKPIANVCKGSRKDLRDAVKAARGAFNGWSNKTAYNRGQILYRIAEVLESRKEEFIQEITLTSGAARKAATEEVNKSIDRIVWYAGWSDKYQQLFGTVNPVAAPYFNFTLPEAAGVIGIAAADELALLPLVSALAPAMAGGNTTVIIASEKYPLSAVTFGEVLATSDVPAGVVNIITGFKEELLPHMAKHMDVNAIRYCGQNKNLLTLLQEEGAANVKRIVAQPSPKGKEWLSDTKAQSPYWIEQSVEMKTVWHPVGV